MYLKSLSAMSATTIHSNSPYFRMLRFGLLIILLFGVACTPQALIPTSTPTLAPTPPTDTPAPTFTATITKTFTSTTTATPTSTTTAPPTPTPTPTMLPTFDPVVGPLILIIGPEEDPKVLDTVLSDATMRGYQFADFSNFHTFSRPFIVIFDNIHLAGVTEKQVQLIETMEKYGNGVLAVNSQSRNPGGVEFLKMMFEAKGWEFAIQGDGYDDISTYTTADLRPYIGYVQMKSQGRVYQSNGFYPRVWVTPYGIYNETILQFIDDHNTVFTEQRMKPLNSPGLMYVVTSDTRLSHESVTGPVEFYPSVRLVDFSFASAPY
jgi:hypothetical protein